jgi:long-chain acyl-CoA synthetase
MILTAGDNVYPADLERVNAEHRDVAMVAASSIPDKYKGELAKDGASPDADNIVAFCREHVAACKVPQAVQFVDDFSKTSSGKIMRRKLHELNACQA